MTERKLATIRKIAEVKPIEGADKIVAYRVDGWWVVGQKDEYSAGDLVVYLEVDSWVPTELAPFLSKGKEPKEFEGVKGERLRTIKLKGQLSQGLLLPLVESEAEYSIIRSDGAIRNAQEGDDVTDFLGILKWEKPLPAQLAGTVKGNFPSFIPKTDQNRIQNQSREFQNYVENHKWEITEKLDGSSMTVYVNHNQLDDEGAPLHGVCSRNLDLKFDPNNSFWEAAIKYNLIEFIKQTGRSLAIQGELAGEGIQGNSYKLTGRSFFCFDIWDIDQQKYLDADERESILQGSGVLHAPVVGKGILLSNIQDGTIASILNYAEGKSVVGAGPQREGLVFKSMTDPSVSFKAISNAWLLKNE